MVEAVEIFSIDAVAYVIPGLGIEQQAAQNGLLGFDGVRWGA